MFQVTLTLDPSSGVPMYEQLYRFFVSEIQQGKLSAGEKLPSKRALCAHLGVSQSTVETAYALLLSEGYLISRPKSGYYVAEFEALSGVSRVRSPENIPELPPPATRPRFDFSTSSVDTSLFPYSSWARLTKEVVYASPELLQHGERQGDAALRTALASFLGAYRGVVCSPAQIVVGAGMEVLMTLLLQLFDEETVFGVEEPGYSSLYHIILGQKRPLRLLDLDSGGVSLRTLTASDADVVYLTASHQFPMGITMSAGRRSKLLRWADERAERYIIEDDYDSEFRYGGRPLPAMQGMAGGGKVIYIGTFSRSLAPSIRMAYMVLPPVLLERYRSLAASSRSTVSRYEQAVMARFLSEGYYARHLRRVGNLYARRREALITALSAIEGVSISGSGGGIHFLLTNPRHAERSLVEKAAEAGIALRGLSSYCLHEPPLPSTVVLGYGGLRDEVISEAAARLKEAWR